MTEVVDAAIRRIEASNPVVNAVVATRFDEARAEAAAPVGDGPFAGVPYLVKSLGGDVAGLPTSRGSRLFADDVAAADSLAVARARAAGVIVLGMTNTPELGKNGTTEPVLHGPTRNPHDLSRSAGRIERRFRGRGRVRAWSRSRTGTTVAARSASRRRRAACSA